MRDRLIALLYDVQDARIDTIADYLLANGIIAPPCKVGDTVYKCLITGDTHEPVIWEIVITYGDIDIRDVAGKSYLIGRINGEHCGVDIDFSDFGKTVFLTREEAEKALAKMKGEKEE